MTDDIYREAVGAYPAEWAFAERSRPVAKSEKKPLPDEVYVTHNDYGEDDTDRDWLACTARAEDHVDAGESKVVGLYKLVRMVRVSTSVSISPE